MDHHNKEAMRTRSKTSSLTQHNYVSCIPSKRLRYTEYTEFLPDEVLIYIFSFLTHQELYKKARCVCKRWYLLVSSPTLWRSITADENIPSDILSKWIQQSPLLKEISLFNRNDLNVMTSNISKYSRNLESIVVKNCWGNSKSNVIKSLKLCKLVKNCKKLHSFNFSQTRIRSTKFFKLLAAKRSSNKLSKCSYCGPISKKQIQALVEALIENQHYFVSSLSTGKKKKVSVNHLLNSQSSIAALAAQDLWETILKSNQSSILDEIEFVENM